MANAIINRSSVMGLSLLMSEYGRRAQVSSRHNFQDICKIVYAVYRCGGGAYIKVEKIIRDSLSARERSVRPLNTNFHNNLSELIPVERPTGRL